MDALAYMVSDVADHAVTCNVYRDTSSTNYGSDSTKVDEVDVYIFNPSSQSQVVVEGSGQDTSLTGLVVPDYDSNDNLVEHVQVGDELRVKSDESKRYDVAVREAIPSEFELELWRLGLNRANASS